MADATDNTVSASAAIKSVVMSVDNNDPVANLAASGRTAQQHLVPSAVKDRNIDIQVTNIPNSVTGIPGFIIFGPIPTGESRTINWEVEAGSDAGQELFVMALQSFYWSTALYPDYTTFITNAPKWPGGGFNMTNLQCSFWIDEGFSAELGIAAEQSFFNNTGADVYGMATARFRLLANVSTLSSNT